MTVLDWETGPRCSRCRPQIRSSMSGRPQNRRTVREG